MVFNALIKSDRAKLADKLGFRFDPWHLQDVGNDELREVGRGLRAFLKSLRACEPKLQLLLQMPAAADRLLTELDYKGPISGVYLFSDYSNLYVGKAKDLKDRYLSHTEPGPNHHKGASFAWALALEQWEEKYDRVKLRNKRVELLCRPEFKELLRQQVAHIKDMSFRWVEERDAAQRDLLEFYCARVLNTPYGRYGVRASASQ